MPVIARQLMTKSGNSYERPFIPRAKLYLPHRVGPLEPANSIEHKRQTLSNTSAMSGFAALVYKQHVWLGSLERIRGL